MKSAFKLNYLFFQTSFTKSSIYIDYFLHLFVFCIWFFSSPVQSEILSMFGTSHLFPLMFTHDPEDTNMHCFSKNYWNTVVLLLLCVALCLEQYFTYCISCFLCKCPFVLDLLKAGDSSLCTFGLCSYKKDFLRSKMFLHDNVLFPLSRSVLMSGEGR